MTAGSKNIRVGWASGHPTLRETETQSWAVTSLGTPSKLRQSQGRGSRGTGAAHLAGTLVCAHLEADGRVVHGGAEYGFWGRTEAVGCRKLSCQTGWHICWRPSGAQ